MIPTGKPVLYGFPVCYMPAMFNDQEVNAFRNYVVGTRVKCKATFAKGRLREAWSETREPTNRRQ